MDEVKAMAAAGEQVGRAVGTGVRKARQTAAHAGRVGATASRQAAARAQEELASRGVTADELRETLAKQTSCLTSTAVGQKGRKARRRMTRNARAVRKELAARIDPDSYRSRRRWPWVLLALAALGVAAAVVLSRRPEEMPVAEADDHPPQHENPDSTGSGR